MNTTLKEIIYNLKNLRQGGRQSQDTLLQDNQYAFIVDYYRVILVNREYENKRAISSIFEQTIHIPFTRVKSMEQDVFNDKRVYKSTIPSVVQTNTRPLLALRKTMFSSALDRSTTISIRHDLNSPTTGHMIRWFPEGKDLFVVTPEPLEKLYGTGVFDHPLEVEKYKAEQGQSNSFDPFDPYNFEYPMSLKIIDALYDMMRKGEINLALATSNDTRADGNEESSTPLRNRSKSQESENES